MSQFRPRPRGTSNITVSLSLDSGASHSSRHDMLAIISSRYQYGSFLLFLLQKLSNYLTADGLKIFSLLLEAPPVCRVNAAFAASATWLIRRHCVAERGVPTGAVPALKPEVTAIFAPQDGRWKITVSFDGRRFCVPKFRH